VISMRLLRRCACAGRPFGGDTFVKRLENDSAALGAAGRSKRPYSRAGLRRLDSETAKGTEQSDVFAPFANSLILTSMSGLPVSILFF
jgi:hypothetical protein